MCEDRRNICPSKVFLSPTYLLVIVRKTTDPVEELYSTPSPHFLLIVTYTPVGEVLVYC